MSDLIFSLPHETYFGVDIANRLASIILQHGSRVLVVTEAILYERNTIEKVLELLEKKNISFIVYDEVGPNATSQAVEEALMLSRGSHADVVVGLGGVRTLSAAKCIAMATRGVKPLDDYLSGTIADGSALAYIEVPTTSRNPFMYRDECLITDARDRSAKILKTQKDITRAIVIDPKFTLTLPPKYTAAILIETFMVAFEGYVSVRNNVLSETFFLKAIEHVVDTLPQITANPEDMRLRVAASTAGFITALGLSLSRAGLGSALTYAINAKLQVPKSQLATVLLPHVLEFFINTSSEKITRLARIMTRRRGSRTPRSCTHRTCPWKGIPG
ncbi:MAG TPA: iron-containing alcohol dehydrogenase, partial [Spirochaetia bacterium]|nr:iron-containing alcohol dehydrogenase [Spirochaetia bacterium]